MRPQVVIDQAPRDVVIMADTGDHLLYAYLDLFHRVQQSTTQRHSTSFLMSASALPLFQVLHAAFIQRKHKELDPFLLSQYGKTIECMGGITMALLARSAQHSSDKSLLLVHHPERLISRIVPFAGCQLRIRRSFRPVRS